MDKWAIFYFSGDRFVADGFVYATDEQEAVWKAKILHSATSVYAKLESRS